MQLTRPVTQETPLALSKVQEEILSRVCRDARSGGLIYAADILNVWQEAKEQGISDDSFVSDLLALVRAGYLEATRPGYYRLTHRGHACWTL